MSDETKDNVVEMHPAGETPAGGPRPSLHMNQMQMHPVDVLREYANQIERGEIAVDGVLILGYANLSDGNMEGHALIPGCAGLNSPQQVFVCENHVHHLLHEFRGVKVAVQTENPKLLPKEPA
ncbi:MAG: hypothetical protein KGL39_06915 [Patescibacteria group bacterium]|nr:hypothetical protein [Patescibacteria group bacterium]